jgi:hypothetical protein
MTSQYQFGGYGKESDYFKNRSIEQVSFVTKEEGRGALTLW